MNAHAPFSDRDIDALFDGRQPTDPRLHDVAGAFASMRASLVVPPDDERVAAEARVLAATVPAQPSGHVAVPAGTRWRRRLIAIGATLAVSAFGVAGAAAANEAAPGDPLYALDQALESVGILDGGLNERLDESVKMSESGDADGALDHAADALAASGDEDAALSLRQAAQAVLQNAAEGDTRSQVSAMLQWMVTAERGDDFGQQVRERAMALGTDATKQQTQQGGQPDQPGNSAEQGAKPDDAGSQGAKPDDAGSQGAKPDDAGSQGAKPDDAGSQGAKPDDAGSQGAKPDDAGSQGAKPANPGSQATTHPAPPAKK